MKKIIISLCVIGLAGFQVAGATSGACSSHGGVNCAAIGVYATCNDWTQSNVFYTDMVECQGENRPACYYPISNCSEEQIQILQTAKSQNIVVMERLGADPQQIENKSQEYDQEISQCQSQIAGYELQKTAFQECLKNQLKQSAQLFNPTPLVAPQTTSRNSSSIEAYVNAEMQKECVGRDPNSFYDTQRPLKGCSCNTGYVINHYNQCVVSTPNSTAPASASLPTPTPNIVPVASSTPPIVQSFAVNANLSLGNSGAKVVSLQKFLESRGFLVMPSGVSEGYFGGATQRALVSFQKANGLPSTGYCGTMTRAVINGL
jgi:hypothetical protein